ncbi:hypothetical protein ACFQ7F_45650 [Streptomyces sp. NPDC056486]|uniref:hypothetical protein n=1 Tax=Streptomyces sp. NPDC056486 TaxID=3345835 RepID=UPI0036C8C58E
MPDNVLAFQWTVAGEGGFHDRKFSLRGGSISFAAHFKIPGTGKYSISLNVVFDDGKYGEQKATFVLRDFLIASIGDSFASGEGNPDSNGLVHSGGWKCEAATLSRAAEWTPDMLIEPKWVEKLAHRSLQGAHALAARSLHKASGRTLDAVGKLVTLDRVTFVSAARSGAAIPFGLLKPQTKPPGKDFIGIGQLEEIRRTVSGRRIDALLVSIGGNDLGFSSILRDLIEGDNIFTANHDNDPGSVIARIDEKIAGLRNDYDHLHVAVGQLLNPKAVFVNGYPTALFDKTMPDRSIGFHACGLFQGWDLDIDASDYNLIRQKGDDLNSLIQEKVGSFPGWNFVDVAPDFIGRGYCDAHTLWVGASESCRNQGDFEGTMHPSREGHNICAARIASRLSLVVGGEQ